MYFVDREKIVKTLDYINKTLLLFQQTQNWSKPIEKLALERLAQNVIEAVIDVGNQMIDGFIMRDPGGYEDIVDILVDERVVSKEDEAGLKQVVQLRKTLVHDYVDIDHERIEQVLNQNKAKLSAFPQQVTEYLEKELGPVSGFKPVNGEGQR